MVDNNEVKEVEVIAMQNSNNDTMSEATIVQNANNTMSSVKTAPIVTKAEFAYEKSNDNAEKAEKDK